MSTKHRMSPTPATRRFALPRLLLALLLALGALISLPTPQARADTLVVTNGNDSGPGSLRQAIADADYVDTITFAPDVTTVTLTTVQLYLQIGITIQGGGRGVTIRRSSAPGTPEFPIFSISLQSIGVKATLQGLTISNGVSSDSGGGIGIGFGSVALIDSTVSDNRAAANGGGIAASGLGTLSLTNSTVNGNAATGGLSSGGGIYNGPGSENSSTPIFSKVILTNSTISGNTARLEGGGIAMESGALTLTSSTLVRNTAAYGEGVLILDKTYDTNLPRPTTMMLRQSVVAGNGIRDCATASDKTAPITSQGYNLVGSGTGCPSDGTGDQVLTGLLATALDPTLRDNGGLTGTHMPVPGGPAVNRIPVADCIATTDQRGVARPQGGACDIGATEYAPIVTLTVASIGSGAVARNPVGSGAGPYAYLGGTLITLTAQPGPGQTFVGWTVDGVARGWANPLILTADDDRDVRATFVPIVPFLDVPQGRADHAAIVALASRGTIRGYGNGNYGPDVPVTRAQMAALIARATPADPGSAPTNGTLAAPACVTGTWDCEDWGNFFTDRGGEDPDLWRNAGALQHYGVALGYGAGQCVAQGVAVPCFAPQDPVTHAQTISFITRSMVVKGYWVQQPIAPLPYAGVPAGHAQDARTFHFYTGGIPAPPANWDAPATRGWFALALWQALNSYWGVDLVP